MNKVFLSAHLWNDRYNAITTNSPKLGLSRNTSVVDFFFFLFKPSSFHVRTFLLPVWERKENHWDQLYLQASQPGLDFLNGDYFDTIQLNPPFLFRAVAFVLKTGRLAMIHFWWRVIILKPPDCTPHTLSIEFFLLFLHKYKLFFYFEALSTCALIFFKTYFFSYFWLEK